jgi:7-cyano-7-deazaguanine synthase
MKEALIILSGGMDSTTLLYDMLKIYKSHEILAVTFNYGSKHSVLEIDAACKTCEMLGVSHMIISVKEVFENFTSALLNHVDSEDIPQGHYEDENMKKTVVPFRNGILLSMAVGLAESEGIKKVFYGAHGGDHAIYPDCRPQFLEAMSKASQEGTYNKVEVLAPYMNNDKIMILYLGTKLNVDYSKTWTCYDPQIKGEQIVACGKCGSCVERIEAFKENKIKDPINYLN